MVTQTHCKSKPRVYQGREVGYSSMAKSVILSHLSRTGFSVIEGITDGGENQQKAGRSKSLVEHLNGGNSIS